MAAASSWQASVPSPVGKTMFKAAPGSIHPARLALDDVENSDPQARAAPTTPTSRRGRGLRSLDATLHCGVCRDYLIQASVLECGHAACAACIASWLAVHPVCPVCRDAVRAEPRLNPDLDRAVLAAIDQLPASARVGYDDRIASVLDASLTQAFDADKGQPPADAQDQHGGQSDVDSDDLDILASLSPGTGAGGDAGMLSDGDDSVTAAATGRADDAVSLDHMPAQTMLADGVLTFDQLIDKQLREAGEYVPHSSPTAVDRPAAATAAATTPRTSSTLKKRQQKQKPRQQVPAKAVPKSDPTAMPLDQQQQHDGQSESAAKPVTKRPFLRKGTKIAKLLAAHQRHRGKPSGDSAGSLVGGTVPASPAVFGNARSANISQSPAAALASTPPRAQQKKKPQARQQPHHRQPALEASGNDKDDIDGSLLMSPRDTESWDRRKQRETDLFRTLECAVASTTTVAMLPPEAVSSPRDTNDLEASMSSVLRLNELHADPASEPEDDVSPMAEAHEHLPQHDRGGQQGRQQQQPAPPSAMVQRVFPATRRAVKANPQQQQQPRRDNAGIEPMLSPAVAAKIAELQEQIATFRRDNDQLSQLRRQHERELSEFRREREQWRVEMDEERQAFQRYREAEERKLRRDRKLVGSSLRERVADDAAARQERSQIDALQEQLAELQRNGKAREQKHAVAIDRMREKQRQQAERINELQAAVAAYEQVRAASLPAQVAAVDRPRSQPGSRRSRDVIAEDDDDTIGKVSSQVRGAHRLHEEQQTEEDDQDTDDGVVSADDVAFLRRSSQRRSNGYQAPHEQTLKDGTRILTYGNGTQKRVHADGSVQISFANGDVKESYPDGRIIYYYREVGTTHTTLPDSTEVYVFDTEQTEKHFPDGAKEISFPDGTVKRISAAGEEETVFPDGMTQRVDRQGERTVEFTNGQREIHCVDGTKKRMYPNGIMQVLYVNGDHETRYPTGRVRRKDRTGKVLFDR